MRRNKRSPFRSSKRHKYAMELILDFDEAVPANRADEVARRILESVRVSTTGIEAADTPTSCRLVSHTTRQSLRLAPPSAREE